MFPRNWRPGLVLQGTPGEDEGANFAGQAGIDEDGDDLDALAEFGLGSSDQDGASGPDRYRVSDESGEVLRTATVNLAARNVRVVPEISLDLESWFEDPGDGTLIELIERTHGGDGSEMLAWRPKIPDAPIFLRLRFELLGGF